MGIREEVISNMESILNGEFTTTPVPQISQGEDIIEAVTYTILYPGSLWRPRLLYAISKPYQVPRSSAMYYGSIIEALHAATLALDDLPQQDNAEKRRGRLSTWKHMEEYMKERFKERRIKEKNPRNAGITTTTLAAHNIGDNFEWAITHGPASDSQNRKIIDQIKPTKLRLCGGQNIDLYGTHSIDSLEGFTEFYRLKTGSLFGAAAAIGGILGGAREASIKKLRDYGEHLGIAFQLADDLKDIRGSPETLGKPTQQDSRSNRKSIFEVASPELVYQAMGAFQTSANNHLATVNGKKFTAAQRLMKDMNRKYEQAIAKAG
jgi:geranylgeranyl pyrophosphate synthase